VLLAAEEASIMARIRAAAPDVLTSFSAADVLEFVTAWHGGEMAAYRAPGVALQIPPSFGDIALVTAESVALAHQLGLEVHVWTIDEPDEMAALLDLGVDALMTDVPSRAVQLLRVRGLR
jgi:glycerophosphoryl diester phosphodiesterase